MAGGGGSGEPGDGFAPFRFTANQSPMPFGGFDTALRYRNVYILTQILSFRRYEKLLSVHCTY